ncbi:MAG: hypothetical protein AAGA75_21515 [Cyanobacteria bacterium P01_E01_bin.6]
MDLMDSQDTYKIEPARLAAAPLEVYEYFYFQYEPEVAYEYWKNHTNPPRGNRNACLASPAKKRRETTGKTELKVLKAIYEINRPCFSQDVHEKTSGIRIENIRVRMQMLSEKGLLDRTSTGRRRKPFSYTITEKGIQQIQVLEKELSEVAA